jgi:hypothetical protein
MTTPDGCPLFIASPIEKNRAVIDRQYISKKKGRANHDSAIFIVSQPRLHLHPTDHPVT